MKIGVSAFAWTSRLKPAHAALVAKVREQGLDAFEVAMFDPADLPVVELRQAFAANDLASTSAPFFPRESIPSAPIRLSASVRKRTSSVALKPPLNWALI